MSFVRLEGIEMFKGVPIVYGAGGFVDDYATNQSYRNDLGFLYCIRIKDMEVTRLDALVVVVQ